MALEFKKDAEMIIRNDPYYDLENGYIEPHKLLENPSDADLVMQAFALVQKFFDDAEEAGVIEEC